MVTAELSAQKFEVGDHVRFSAGENFDVRAWGVLTGRVLAVILGPYPGQSVPTFHYRILVDPGQLAPPFLRSEDRHLSIVVPVCPPDVQECINYLRWRIRNELDLSLNPDVGILIQRVTSIRGDLANLQGSVNLQLAEILERLAALEGGLPGIPIGDIPGILAALAQFFLNPALFILEKSASFLLGEIRDGLTR